MGKGVNEARLNELGLQYYAAKDARSLDALTRAAVPYFEQVARRDAVTGCHDDHVQRCAEYFLAKLHKWDPKRSPLINFMEGFVGNQSRSFKRDDWREANGTLHFEDLVDDEVLDTLPAHVPSAEDVQEQWEKECETDALLRRFREHPGFDSFDRAIVERHIMGADTLTQVSKWHGVTQQAGSRRLAKILTYMRGQAKPREEYR